MLHVICTRLHPGHLSVRVEDSLRRTKDIVKKKKKKKKKSRIVPFNGIIIIIIIFKRPNRLVGLMIKASASKAEDSGFESRFRRDFSRVESYQ